MPMITVEGVEFNSEDLSDNGKAQLASLQFLQVQMRKLETEIKVYKAARIFYASALKDELPEIAE